ncbi:hypothetical protein OPU71_06415 [Niveibacterium sp. 24ML]|uniref:hypothetical protein n=1 Tax=Niveibacterium sp. 24ML TaxID=2985512 RepID=UPI00226E3CBF|nr:hypothetical protein [Niveibacterium sp. 24ML]MCX9155758.1 hypothetical protein [Niveibacterium sp. 24ML]
MSTHFSLVVVKAPGDTGFALAEVLAPFEQHSRSEPYGRFCDTSARLRWEYEHSVVDPILWFTREVTEPQAGMICAGDVPLQTASPAADTAAGRSTPLKALYPRFEDFLLAEGYSPAAIAAGRIGYWYNPQRRCNGWLLGGRWRGFFKVKPGFEAQTRLGDPLRYDDPAPEGFADVVLKKHWDVEAQRTQNVRRAVAAHAAFHHASDGVAGAAPSRAQALGMLDAISIERLVGTRLAPCPAHGAMPESGEANAYPAVTRASLARFGADEAGFVEYVRQNTALPFALLVDGQWYAEARLFDHGADAERVAPQDWVREASALLAAQADDAELFAVDCYL